MKKRRLRYRSDGEPFVDLPARLDIAPVKSRRDNLG